MFDIIIQPISKKRFWFKIKAEKSFKPQTYSSISRTWNSTPTPILGQKTFLRWGVDCILDYIFMLFILMLV